MVIIHPPVSLTLILRFKKLAQKCSLCRDRSQNHLRLPSTPPCSCSGSKAGLVSAVPVRRYTVPVADTLGKGNTRGFFKKTIACLNIASVTGHLNL